MTSNPSLSWQKIQDVYYSLVPCYETLNWSIGNLYGDHKVKISSHSTSVALSSKYTSHPSVIDIYTISGNNLWSVVYNSTTEDHIVDYEFYNEDLYVVLSNQKFRHYKDLKGSFDEYVFTKDLITLDNFGESDVFLNNVNAEEIQGNSNGKTGGKDHEGTGKLNKHVITNLENNEPEEVFQIFDTYIWGSFLVLRLTNRFIITNLADNHRNYEILIPVTSGPQLHDMALIELTDDGFSAVICYGSTALTLKVDLKSSSYELVDHELTDGPFTKVTVSPNGHLVALLNEQVSTIFVISSSFTQVLLEYDTSNDSSSPYQIEWCANDAIVLSLRDEIKVVGPNQASISFFYDFIDEDDLDFDAVLKGTGDDELSFTIAHLKSEPDGLKILTTKKVEFLSRVSESSRNLYQIGSSHPGSILLDCIDKLTQQSSKADTNISLLKSDVSLINAMDSCLDVALDEFNPQWQKKLLSAVTFGKAYVDGYYNSEKYLKVINTIKVLNQLKSADISLFLTSKEADILGWDKIIGMLLNRDQYLLALKVISLLDLQYLRDKIYVHWCCYKIKKEIDVEDSELYKIIAKKLVSARDDASKKNYVSVVEISEIAFEEGRLDLCNYLINLEPTIVKKVEQYLKFEKLEIALIKAFESAEYDLVKVLLMHLHSTLSVSQFFKILHQNESHSITDPISEDIDTSNQILVVDGNLVESFWVQSIGKHHREVMEKYYKQEDMKVELSIERLKYFLKQNESPPDISTGLLTYYEDYKMKLLKLSGSSGDRQNYKFHQSELDVLELQKKLSDTYQTDFFSTKSLSQILVKLINMHQLKQGHKIVKDFKMSLSKFWYLILETYCSTSNFDRLHQFILSSSNDKTNLKSPIGFQIIVETCLAYKGPPNYISMYINQCSDIHYLDKCHLFISNNDLVSAANEAYKYKDIEFLNSLLDRANKHANDSVVQSIKGLITRLGY
ncbi:Vacuolar protein sorting-associated protein 16 [Yamadazyma tenuis]|uniref:Vacuolar protein sorting-associated protein 16 homolog n=1 Tax=Candida tenuis (strain ATCC 10573 / BCRC 21748 / CBS 615 / JCM 9827 / NBRC 10315 / NRRL Y-1498 / VKM Y-70) TaxID=590646 RepID=G3B9V6_CANTC|nr:uncharacterized protein CANTEDRAFT_125387 [Yamadazyma tenuis ATCC 10573]EGV61977.1 hypothetical protein CANTEDRAFT_125387 [Yamadazyma tenuis ATCC 10573]WEJ93227.1 Vacuolar protein sorting-associated protein 16 [Yamadazyma tenuis]